MLPQHTILGCQAGTNIAIPTRDSNGKRISISELETQLKQIHRSLQANDNFKLLLQLNNSSATMNLTDATKSRKYNIYTWTNSMGTRRYGKYNESKKMMQLCNINAKGLYIPQRCTYVNIDVSNCSIAAKWKNTIVGPASNTFPIGSEWQIIGSNTQLDKETVRSLTKIFNDHKNYHEPSCVKAWNSRLTNETIDWETLPSIYKETILNANDFASHFKLITHRGFFTNSRKPETDNRLCRLCHQHIETIQHFCDCSKLDDIWSLFAQLIESPYVGSHLQMPMAMKLFGQDLPGGAKYMLVLLWKSILIGLTKLSIENKPFPTTDKIFKIVLSTFSTRALSLSHKYQLLKYNASIRHKEHKPPNNSTIAPLASIDDSTANISFSPIITNKLLEYELDAFIADS